MATESQNYPIPEFIPGELVQHRASKLRAVIINFLEKRDIRYIDVTVALQSAFKHQQQPYRVGHDGHPNLHGHQAIASYIAEYFANGQEDATEKSSHPLVGK